MNSSAFTPEELRASAQRHLWLHFSSMSAFEDSPMPIIASGRGCRLTDIDGKDYLDALSGLFVVQAGYGRAEIAAPASAQAEDLAYVPLWG